MPLSVHPNKVVFRLAFFILICLQGSIFSQQDSASAPPKNTSEEKGTEPLPPRAGEVFKPTLGLGVGNLSFFGDAYQKHFQPPMVGRFGYELNVTQPLTSCLMLNFYVMFGKLGVNERTPTHDFNFESTIRMGGIQLLYDFSNFIKSQNLIRPYIMTGIESFEFLSKTDLRDKYGNTYYYWNDGSIKNMPQGSPGSQNAVNLVRDHSYESDIRTLNINNFGPYAERSWAIPIGAGFIMNLGPRVKFRGGATLHYALTNHLEIHPANETHVPNDKFFMMSASLNYDLVVKRKDKEFDTLLSNHFDGVNFAELYNADEDKDGVRDFDDDCHGTPAGVKVDAKGCPLDEDKDLVKDYHDDELPTPATMIANGRGVGITDKMAQDWYDDFYDSTGIHANIVNLDSARGHYADPMRQPKRFTVELARYKGGIPNDEMAYLLSIGDVKSFSVGDTTVVYAAGNYEDVRIAVKRRDEFRKEGMKSARVGYFKGDNYFTMTEPDLNEEVDAAKIKYGKELKSGGAYIPVRGEVIFRVQLGAYRNKLSPTVFRHAGNVIELQTAEGLYRYATGAYRTLTDAAMQRAELVPLGYPDAFITAYKDGKRIALKDAGAIYENKNYKEDLNESANSGSAFDKSKVVFKLQLGPLRLAGDPSFEEKAKVLKDFSKQSTPEGKLRYTSGSFNDYNAALKYKSTLVAKGYSDASVIALFNGDLISIQEAMDLLGK